MNYVESFNLFGVEAKEIPCIKGEGAPTSDTEGAVGCLYMDSLTGEIYKCLTIVGGSYVWRNIVANSNWNQNDSTAPDYIKNRPFYEYEAFKPIAWDGSTQDREWFTFQRKNYDDVPLKLYKVSDEFISLTDIKSSVVNITEFYTINGQLEEMSPYNANTDVPSSVYNNRNDFSCIGYLVDDPYSDFLIIASSAKSGEHTRRYDDTGLEYTFTIPSAGTYMWCSLDSFKIDMQSEKKVTKIDEKYLPESEANKEYVDNLVGDIETALDSIIAIQNELIGGEG